MLAQLTKIKLIIFHLLFCYLLFNKVKISFWATYFLFILKLTFSFINGTVIIVCMLVLPCATQPCPQQSHDLSWTLCGLKHVQLQPVTVHLIGWKNRSTSAVNVSLSRTNTCTVFISVPPERPRSSSYLCPVDRKQKSHQNLEYLHSCTLIIFHVGNSLKALCFLFYAFYQNSYKFKYLE